jgi:hypothetical protein
MRLLFAAFEVARKDATSHPTEVTSKPCRGSWRCYSDQAQPLLRAVVLQGPAMLKGRLTKVNQWRSSYDRRNRGD